MGLEVIIGAITAVTAVVGGIAQANATASAANAQKEANAVQGAQQQVSSVESRRQRVREARIRRAQLIAGSENQGSTGSSGQIGSIGALSTNLAGLFGSSLGESNSNAGINKNLQSAADFTATANTIGAWTNTITSGLGGFQSVFKQ